MLHTNLRSPRAHLLTVLAVVALVLASCTTMEPYELQGDPVQRYEGNGYTMRLEYLDEAYLRARYGQRNNTFIPPPGLTSERFLAFELEVDTDRALRIDATSIELQFGPSFTSAQNRFNFGQHWNLMDEREGRSGNDMQRRQDEINSTLIPNQWTFVPGQRSDGVIVFRGRLPLYGTAKIIVPIMEPSGRPTERAEFEFEF